MSPILIVLSALPGPLLEAAQVPEQTARFGSILGVEASATRTVVPLVDDGPIVEHALRGAGSFEWKQADHEWTAPVDVETIRGLTVGDRLDWWSPEQSRGVSCRVAGFELWREPAWERAPSEVLEAGAFLGDPCGGRGIRAVLTCDGRVDRLGLATSPGRGSSPFFREVSEIPQELRAGALAAVLEASTVRASFVSLKGHAAEQETRMTVEHTIRRFERDDASILVVGTRAYTGEGDTACGGPDREAAFETFLSVGADGRIDGVIVPSREQYEPNSMIGLSDVDGDGAPEVFRSDYDSVWALETLGEEPILRQERRSCGCGC